MTNHTTTVNTKGTVALLKNVAACMAAMARLQDRGPGRPGLGVFYGFSGYGKSYAAIYVQNKTRAAMVEVGESWTRKDFLKKTCIELNVDTKGSVSALTDRIIETLSDDDRPLIIDEADKCCDKGFIELVREIQMKSGASVLLIGEEKLPAKLAETERVDNRVLHWEPAQPCDLDDARALARQLSPIEIADDLLERVRAESGGKARRIVVNLDLVTEAARNLGVTAMGAGDFSGDFYTGATPKARGRE